MVEELSRDLRDGRAELSDTLREIFLSRVDELPPHAHEVVHAVAAGVEPVEHALLARVLPLPETELIEAVGSAVLPALGGVRGNPGGESDPRNARFPGQ